MTGLLFFAHSTGPILLAICRVEGPEGLGKTTLLQAWQTSLGLSQTHVPPLSLRPHMNEPLPPAIHSTRALHRETPAQFARRLREERGAPPGTARSAQQLWQQVRDDLAAIPVALLVIDQAECLSLQLWKSCIRVPL